MKKIKTLRINRQRWATGEDGGKLLNNHNSKMCCLGFFCRQAGIRAKDIRGLGMPDEVCKEDWSGNVVAKPSQLPAFNILVNSRKQNRKLANQLAGVNDSTAPKFVKHPAVREARIKELFGKAGVNVVFTGKTCAA